MAKVRRIQFPHVPIWVNDFMGDTQHLDCLETGAYLLLIFAAWRTAECGLPDDDRQLARMARCTPRKWTKIRPTVMAFWHMGTDGLWHQKRLDKVRAEVTVKYLKAVQAGQASALKRLESGSTSVVSKYQRPYQRPYQLGSNQSNHEREESSFIEISTDAARDPAQVGGSGPRASRPQTMKERMAALAALNRRKFLA